MVSLTTWWETNCSLSAIILKGSLMPPACSCRHFALQASNNPQQFTMVCLRTWWETNCLLSAIIPSKAIWCHLNWLLHVHADVLHFKLVTQSPIIYYGMPKNMVRNELFIISNNHRLFHGPYFHFCMELAPETWVKPYQHILCGFRTLDTPTH